MLQYFSAIKPANRIYELHRGRCERPPLVRVLPCGLLYQIEWPDTGLSPITNLTRCKDAAREWAEHSTITEDRKNNAARRLKSLNNFWWSSSPIAANEPATGAPP
jgi:hypothetical protein